AAARFDARILRQTVDTTVCARCDRERTDEPGVGVAGCPIVDCELYGYLGGPFPGCVVDGRVDDLRVREGLLDLQQDLGAGLRGVECRQLLEGDTLTCEELVDDRPDFRRDLRAIDVAERVQSVLVDDAEHRVVGADLRDRFGDIDIVDLVEYRVERGDRESVFRGDLDVAVLEIPNAEPEVVEGFDGLLVQDLSVDL